MINVSDAVIREAADVFVERGLADVGFRYIGIDDCWMQTSPGMHAKRNAQTIKKHASFNYQGVIFEVPVCGCLLLLSILASKGQLVSASPEDYHNFHVAMTLLSEVGDPNNRRTSAPASVFRTDTWDDVEVKVDPAAQKALQERRSLAIEIKALAAKKAKLERGSKEFKLVADKQRELLTKFKALSQ